jgi:NADH-quinone oxidoreductase subunit F
MDLRIPDTPASPDEHDALDRTLGPIELPAEGWQRESGGVQHAASLRHLLLPALHALVDRVGYVSEGGLAEICRRLEIPPADAYGVATFYSMLPVEPTAPTTVYVCEDLACMRRSDGANGTQSATNSDPTTRTVHAPCLGLCEQAPATLTIRSGINPEHEVHGLAPNRGSVPQQGDPSLVLLRRIGRPTDLGAYLADGGYTALQRALAIGGDAVIGEITASRLVGRGGAAFPTGRKWAAVASQRETTRYVVANADESEPGTFKDRVVLEGDPFALVEAMTIAGTAVGAQHGYVYLRDEYRTALHTLSNALDEARAAGYLGSNILGSGLSFDIEIVRGAGAYICGEETAIFNSIEGYRGEPRSKPPFPVEVGLFGRPTLVNNVETLVSVLPILQSGGEQFASTGSGSSTGTKLFCLSGSVVNPGVYEVPFGVTLGGLIELAGGMTPGRTLRAVLLGGAAGSFVGPDELGLPLTFEATRAAGTTLGSGVVLVLDETDELGAILRRISAFFRHESCGQCVPCRVGTVRQDEIVTRITLGRRRERDGELLRDIGQAMRDASICGLGQTAWNAIESAIDRLGALR